MGEKNKDGLLNVFNTSLQIQTILSITVILLLETVGLWYVNNIMVIPFERHVSAFWVYQFSVVSLVFVILQIPFSASIIAHEKMGFFALVSIIDAVAKLGIAIALPYFQCDRLLIYGLYLLAVSIINFLLYFFYSCSHFSEIRLRYSFDKSCFTSMLSFLGWNIFGTFAFMIRSQGLTVLLNFFFGAIVNAAQGVAAQIQSAIQGFSGNIVVAFRPQMIQSYAAGEYERVGKLFYSLSKVSYLMLFMLSAPVAFEVDYILKLWLGDAIPEYTSYFTILVLANMVLLSLHTPIVTIIHASGKMKVFQIVTGLLTCSILPISWCFLRLGAKPGSVYWVSFVMQIINQIACLITLRSVFPYELKKYLQFVVLPILLVSISVVICEFGIVIIMNDSFLRLLLVCAISVVVTIVISYMTMTQSEKNLVKDSIIKRVRINKA